MYRSKPNKTVKGHVCFSKWLLIAGVDNYGATSKCLGKHGLCLRAMQIRIRANNIQFRIPSVAPGLGKLGEVYSSWFRIQFTKSKLAMNSYREWEGEGEGVNHDCWVERMYFEIATIVFGWRSDISTTFQSNQNNFPLFVSRLNPTGRRWKNHHKVWRNKAALSLTATQIIIQYSVMKNDPATLWC